MFNYMERRLDKKKSYIESILTNRCDSKSETSVMLLNLITVYSRKGPNAQGVYFVKRQSSIFLRIMRIFCLIAQQTNKT